jgi:hypothetical protein
MVVGDSIKIPVNITNLGTASVTTRLTETTSNGTSFRIQSLNPILVPAGQTVRTFLTANALEANSDATLTIVATGSVGNKMLTAQDSRSLSIVEPVGIKRI